LYDSPNEIEENTSLKISPEITSVNASFSEPASSITGSPEPWKTPRFVNERPRRWLNFKL